MSNYLSIVPTKFVNTHDEKDVEFGYRWWDDENDGFDHTADWDVPQEPIAFLAFVFENCRKDPFTDIVDYCYRTKRAIIVARNFMEWEIWGPVYEKHLEEDGFEPPELEQSLTE